MFPPHNIIYYTDTEKNLSLRFCDCCKIFLNKHKKTMIIEEVDPKQHGFQQVLKLKLPMTIHSVVVSKCIALAFYLMLWRCGKREPIIHWAVFQSLCKSYSRLQCNRSTRLCSYKWRYSQWCRGRNESVSLSDRDGSGHLKHMKTHENTD